MTTIDGPDGISASTDKNIPMITEKIPINVATTTNERIKHKGGFWKITAQELQIFEY